MLLAAVQAVSGLQTTRPSFNHYVYVPPSSLDRRSPRTTVRYERKPDGELQERISDIAFEEGKDETVLETTTTTSPSRPPPPPSEPTLSFQERLDEFLDRPFFDPNAYNDVDEKDTSFMAKFARLVKSDYELAETLYVSLVFVVLVIVSQELLRMQLNGDAYIPFGTNGGVGAGKLF